MSDDAARDHTPSPETAARPEDATDLRRIREIPLTIHVELGRRKMRISELLDAARGAVVELETTAGAALSIYANDVLIAEGEAVVVGERYGVKITDIVPPTERVRRLGTPAHEEG